MHRFCSLLLAIIALAAACSTGEDEATVPSPAPPIDVGAYARRGPHAVGVTTIELVNTSRPTPANAGYAGSAERRIPLEVWYPATAPAGVEEAVDAPLEGGPYPLVVFAHGFSSFRRQSASYAQHLASHGYIVAAPDFPTTSLTAPGGPRLAGVLEQPADVAFVIDEMARFSDEAGHPLAGAFDGRAGVTGHSLGGLTSLLAIYGPLRDERVLAAVPFAAPACFLSDDLAGDLSVPVLHVGGSEDLIVDPASVRAGYEASRAPRYLVELQGGDHLGFTDLDIADTALVDTLREGLLSRENLEDDGESIAEAVGPADGTCIDGRGARGLEPLAKERQRELMRLLGALFFDAYLRGDEAALSLLRGGALGAALPEASIEFE